MTPTEKDDYNQLQIDKELVTGSHLTRLTELWQDVHFLKADGLCGPITRKSVLDGGSDDEVAEGDTDPLRVIRTWPDFHGPLDAFPRNRREIYKMLGNPANGGKADRKWVRENIRTYRKKHALPGVDPHRYVKMHRLMEPYAREAMARATSVSDYVVDRFGCYVFRLMRSVNRLSLHSWGWAFDINPHENFSKRYASIEKVPAPWSEEWYLTWPNGMDKAFVDAIKSVGFSWGGDWRTFKDPMHFELVVS